VAGNHATREKLVLSQLGIEPGKPLNFEQSTSGRRARCPTDPVRTAGR
jgi:hypothetical protein